MDPREKREIPAQFFNSKLMLQKLPHSINNLSPSRRSLLLGVRQSFVETAPPFTVTSHSKSLSSHNPISDQGNLVQSGHTFLTC
jgi:hypothetical protein